MQVHRRAAVRAPQGEAVVAEDCTLMEMWMRSREEVQCAQAPPDQSTAPNTDFARD